jgi:hypothetical protein
MQKGIIPQVVSPVSQAMAQRPLTHCSPDAQVTSQAPQLALSRLVSRQAPAQEVPPEGQRPQTPMTQA